MQYRFDACHCMFATFNQQLVKVPPGCHRHAAFENMHIQKVTTYWFVDQRAHMSVFFCTRKYNVNTKWSPKELFLHNFTN